MAQQGAPVVPIAAAPTPPGEAGLRPPRFLACSCRSSLLCYSWKQAWTLQEEGQDRRTLGCSLSSPLRRTFSPPLSLLHPLSRDWHRPSPRQLPARLLLSALPGGVGGWLRCRRARRFAQGHHEEPQGRSHWTAASSAWTTSRLQTTCQGRNGRVAEGGLDFGKDQDVHRGRQESVSLRSLLRACTGADFCCAGTPSKTLIMTHRTQRRRKGTIWRCGFLCLRRADLLPPAESTTRPSSPSFLSRILAIEKEPTPTAITLLARMSWHSTPTRPPSTAPSSSLDQSRSRRARFVQFLSPPRLFELR